MYFYDKLKITYFFDKSPEFRKRRKPRRMSGEWRSFRCTQEIPGKISGKAKFEVATSSGPTAELVWQFCFRGHG